MYAVFIAAIVLQSIRGSISANIIVALTNAMSTKSHSFSLGRIADGLVARGHHVTVLAGSNKGTMGFKSFNDTLIYDIPYTAQETDELQDRFTQVSFRKRSVFDYADVLPVAHEYFDVIATGCHSLFDESSNLRRLRSKHFDAIVGIPFCSCDADDELSDNDHNFCMAVQCGPLPCYPIDVSRVAPEQPGAPAPGRDPRASAERSKFDMQSLPALRYPPRLGAYA